MLRTVVSAAPLVGALVLACAGAADGRAPCPEPPQAPPLPAAEIDASLFLIGDGGQPRAGGEPVLEALAGQISAAAAALGGERVLAVFLGDNLYPAGLPPAHDRSSATLRARLDAQLAVFSTPLGDAGPRGVFVPGNHDWHDSGEQGWERVRRQREYIADHGDGRVRLLPAGGCPGPVVVDVGEDLRLVALDTQWWLHRHARPLDPDSACPADSPVEVLTALRESLGDAGSRRVAVVAHHPLASGGPHGYPSLYRRRIRRRDQDLTAQPYARLVASLRDAFGRRPPLLFAGGHDHSLQLIRGEVVPWLVVSGAASSAKLSRVETVDGTLFCRQATGFFRLDIARDGRARLAIHVLAAGTRTAPEIGAVAVPAPAP